MHIIETKEEVTIKFAGDSGDGMQLTGNQFTNNSALLGNDIATFPDFPAEIRAPQGTLAGVSGFQLHFGSVSILTPGDTFDVLVAMNVAALKSNIKRVKRGGIIIADIAGFDKKNMRLAKYPDGAISPLEDDTLSGYQVFQFDITRLTRECLANHTISTKDKDRSKNMFVLGFLYWMYNRDMASTKQFLTQKFAKKPDLLDANLSALQAGYNFGDTTETFTTRYKVEPAKIAPGTYRGIMGNQAIVLGLITASQKSGLPLFYGSYPITPASDILHQLARYKNFDVRTFQAEDEIAAVCATLGAAYGGCLGVTGTSGPGIALKAEAMGLAVMLELPMLIIDVQRGGPSTGLPTKTEQSDLLQVLYGRNGECPLPVLSTSSPADCFDTVIEAVRIATQFMTPVVLLSDGYIANGAEPWKVPDESEIAEIPVQFAQPNLNPDPGNLEQPFMPYERNQYLARPWALPGTPALMHRIGGLEKEDGTGNVSYDAANHEYMVKIREAKISGIAQHLPPQTILSGPPQGDVLVLGWGSTYGAIQSAVIEMLNEGYAVAHAHLRHIRPMPANLGQLLLNYKTVLVPEINNGQLARLLRDLYLLPIQQYNKIQGTPITKGELKEAILQCIKHQQ